MKGCKITSPSRGEDEGEGFQRICPGSTLTSPPSKSAQYVRNHQMRSVKIHPTALVDPAAKIGVDVEIGPYSVVGSQVTFGEKTIVQSHVVIEGQVTIGSGNLIGHGAVIGAPPQDVSFSPERKTKVEIGDNNIIREYCTIHRGTAEGSATKIGNRNFLMAGAHIGHNCEIGNNVIIANNCLLAGLRLRGRRRVFRRRINISPVHAHRATGNGSRQLCIWQRIFHRLSLQLSAIM